MKILNKNLRLYGAALSYWNANEEIRDKVGELLKINFKNVDRCKINGIPLEWVQITTDDRSGSVKTHTLEDRDSTLISSNVSNNNRKYNIKIILTDFETNNPDETYQSIVNFWQQKKLCTLSTIENIEDIVITKVSRNYTNPNSFEFSLDFEVLEFAYFLKKGEIAEANKTILSDVKETGTAGTRLSKIKFGGFL